MLKLNAARLKALGAPAKAGAPQIEAWLRGLLGSGTLRDPQGVVEYRGPIPIVTTLKDLKQACGVALETVKQGLRPLEMDHWILLVDGAHTRLLGPPRFRVHVEKENLWGSLSRAVEVTVTEGLSPLESVDYEQLRRREVLRDRKPVLALDPLTLEWSSQVRLAGGAQRPLRSGESLTLAAGSAVRLSGQPSLTQQDLKVAFDQGRQLRASQPAVLLLGNGSMKSVSSGSPLRLERSSVVRLANGQTGILELQCLARRGTESLLDWGADTPWLSWFQHDMPLILLRRAVYAELPGVVQESCAGVGPAPAGSDTWRIVLGYHDCILDATLPFRAGKTSLKQSQASLLRCLKHLKDTDSMREAVEAEFGFTVGAADVRISPVAFATAGEKGVLRQLSGNPSFNSELLGNPARLPCWSQVGAYYRKGDLWPWEITRELYFAYVQVHYHQQEPAATP